MSDALQTFFDETSTQRFSIEDGGCGAWAVRWNMRRTGISVELPAVSSWEDAAGIDMVAAFRSYAQRFGLKRKETAERGDTGLFNRTAKFERRGDHVTGIYAGEGFWAFKGRAGLKFLRATPLEVWG